MKPRVGMVTIGQAPRVDVVPAMADVLGRDVEIIERGALDGLDGDEIAQLAPESDDEVLVTRLTDGSSVFVGKRSVTARVQRMIAELDALGVSMTVVLCTGHFSGLRARRPLVEPDKILLGVLRGVSFEGRLGVLTPSERHVEPTTRRWREHGFDPVVVAASPYGHAAPISLVADRLRAGGVGFVVLDCIGFQRSQRDALQAALDVPVIVANLLVARVVAELLST
jgi:protein AroM